MLPISLLLLAIRAIEDYFQPKIMEDTPAPIAEIDHGPSKLDQFLEKNQKKLIILALLIFIGVIVFVFLRGYEAMTEEKAGAKLLEANSEEDYNAVITQFPDRIAAGTAASNIASLRTNDEDAIKALSHFIATYSDHPLVPNAKFNLASRQINAGKTEEAQATLEDLIEHTDIEFLLPKAKLALGDIALGNNDKKTAENYYNEALEYKDSKHAYAGEAKAKLEYINAEKPLIVDAPPKLNAPTSPQTLLNPTSPQPEPVQSLELPGTNALPTNTTQPDTTTPLTPTSETP